MIGLRAELRAGDQVLRALSAATKEQLFSQLFAANRVAALSRTEAVRAIRLELGISAKATRARIKVFRATRRKPRARLWAGTKIAVPLYEGGTLNKGVRDKAPRGSFVQTMRSGHRGLFYRAHRSGQQRHRSAPGRRGGPDLPIREVRVSIKAAAESKIPTIAQSKWKDRYEDLYWRDFNRRLASRGWRR